jgi:hypothetical protein
MRMVTSAMAVCAFFQSQGPANRQGIDVFVEAPSGKALGDFDGVTVLQPKC